MLFTAQTGRDPLQRAAALMQKGRMEDAEKVLSAFLKSKPRDANALNMLGIIRGEQDRIEEAEKLFKDALKSDPRLVGATVNLGYLYRKTQRAGEALAAFEAASKLQPADPEIQFNIASLKTDGGEFPEALALLARIPPKTRPPTFPAVQARCLLGLGRISELKAAFPEMRELLAPYPSLLGEFAQLLLGARLIDETIQFLEEIKGSSLGSYPVTFHLGEAYQMKGNQSRAAEYYRLALRIEPRSVETLKRLAVISQRQEKWEDMFHYMTLARQLAPNSAPILYGFAIAALRTVHVGDSQSAVHQAMSLEPDNAAYVYLYGLTQMTLSDIAAATQTYQKYVQMKPQDPMGHLALAFALYEGARYEEALAALQTCRELNPELLEPLYYLGMIALNRGEMGKAMDYLIEVVTRDPKHSAAHLGLGTLYFKLRDYEKAKKELEASLALNPSHATTHYQLSQVLMRLGDTEGAQREADLYSTMKTQAQEKRDAATRLMVASP
jgi:tetratricopeptide (TPR) repeat protein